MNDLTLIKATDLSIGYDKKAIISNLSLELNKGQLCCLLGANGIGKSTLLKTLSSLLEPIKGDLELSGIAISEITAHQRAQKVSIVLNNQNIDSDLLVRELVELGRSPYTSWLGNLKDNDIAKVMEAIQACQLEHLSNKPLSHISDGERQRAMIARCLAQDTKLMLLDEPTAFLDYPNQINITQLLKKLTLEQGKTIILSTHDWTLAFDIADQLWVLTEKGKLLQGSPEELKNNDEFKSIFASHKLTFDDNKMRFISNQ